MKEKQKLNQGLHRYGSLPRQKRIISKILLTRLAVNSA